MHTLARNGLALFAEYIVAGRPCSIEGDFESRINASHPVWHYYVFYYIANHLASESLCNAIMDKITSFHEESRTLPNFAHTCYVLDMGRTLKPMDELFLQHLAWQKASLKDFVAVEQDWDKLGRWQLPLFKLLMKDYHGNNAQSHLAQ